MKHILYLLSLCSLLLVGCNRQQDDDYCLSCIQILDRNGAVETISLEDRIKLYEELDYLDSQPYEQILRIFKKEGEAQNRQIITAYHPNGKARYYLEGKDSIANGTFKEWHSNGLLKIESTVIGGPCDLSPSSQKNWLFDGKSTVWDQDGNTEAVFSYKDGLLDGKTIYYYPNGSLAKVVPFEQGLISGELCEYYENGTLKLKCFYEKGIKQGPSLGYFEDERPSFFEEYEEGLLKTGIYYDFSEKVLSEVQNGFGKKSIYHKQALEKQLEYRNGILEGEILEFSDNGILQSRYHIKDGKKQGEEISYFSCIIDGHEQRPKLLITWDQDMIHGPVKSWYEDGTLESQKEYHRNQKNGLSFSWYQNGGLMLAETYENDHLTEGQYYKFGQKNSISKIERGSGTATIFDGKSTSLIRKIEYQNGKPQE